MQPIDSSKAWKVRISWSHLRYLDRFFQDPRDDYAYLYAIWARFGYAAKLLYIRKVYEQYVSDRLKQPDHLRRRQKMERKYRRHSLAVSLGEIEVLRGGKITWYRIDEVERLLIYANRPEFNRSATQTHGVYTEYIIENLGGTRSMYRILYNGFFGN